MLLDIVGVLRGRAATAHLSAKASILALQTTRPLYMVFDSTSEHPDLVVEHGTREEICSFGALLRQLGTHSQDLVPRSVDEFAIAGTDRWLHVQTGLPGCPWFKLGERFTSDDERQAVVRRAAEALRRLHDSIAQNSAWSRLIEPATAMSEMIERARSIDLNISSAAWLALEGASVSLRPLGSFRWHVQHGDMCLNNLLIADESVGVVDFEEFALTNMPLHDEIGLAISCREMFDLTDRWPDADDPMSVCTAHVLRESPWLSEHLGALTLVFFLWRILQSHGIPKRAMKLARMLRYIELETARSSLS
jgi:hypothetical protein